VVLVYDLGGGTFDITMIEVKGRSITVLCTGGDHNLGGKDWDTALVNYLVSQFQEQTGCTEDILDNPETLQDLFINAERAKKILSQRDKAPLVVTHGGQRAKVELTRDKFDELTAKLLDRTVTLTCDMLAEAKIKEHTQYDKILLVGGCSRMPQVAQRLKDEFKVECEMYDPDEAVAKGAAVYSWKLALDDQIKITIAGWTGQDAVDVDVDKVGEVTAKKAQEQVAQKFGLLPAVVKKAAQIQVKNVTSKTFGIVALNEQRAEKVFNLIRRNDSVPADETRDFGTVEANQINVEICLREGLELNQVSELAQCTEIGKAELPLPPGLPAGSLIRVTFKLNEQGRLEVTATEPKSGKTIQFEVQTAGVMSPEEVEEAKSRALAMSVS
jgi:molecular chaperone DnaK (HSP70)